MKYGSVSTVSLELSITFDLNRDFSFRRVCSPTYCEFTLPTK